jgi:hypothetical protein
MEPINDFTETIGADEDFLTPNGTVLTFVGTINHQLLLKDSVGLFALSVEPGHGLLPEAVRIPTALWARLTAWADRAGEHADEDRAGGWTDPDLLRHLADAIRAADRTRPRT